MKKLNRNTISVVTERPTKILQFGEGNFLRAFVDWMVDILNEKTSFNGAIQIVQPIEKGMSDLIDKQDGLYHVLLEGIEKGEKVQTSRLITSVKGILNPYQDYAAFLKLAENPDLEYIISNTTEAGIVFDENDHGYDIIPHSFPGKLTALLHHRFQHFKGNPTGKLYILPCELIEKNGQKLKDCLLRYVDHWSLEEAFKTWLLKDVIFYNTLVDRIVPGFPKDSISEIQQRLQFEDYLVVKAEPFHLWVIEGPKDLGQKLDFKKAGLNVIFTDDLSPYRTRKVRILNGAHTAMVPIAYLHGFRKVREVVEDKQMAAFLNQIIFDEIIPTLDMPKDALMGFAEQVLDRFRNPFIQHRLIDISLNSISKFKVRVLPSILGYLKKYGEAPEGLATAFAYLLLFYSGKNGQESIPLMDDESHIVFFRKAWESDNFGWTLEKILSNEVFWKVDLTKNRLLFEFLLQTLKTLCKSKLSFD